MIPRRAGAALAAALLCLAALHAQQPVTPLDDAAAEEFLRSARIVDTRRVGSGVTDSTRATLSNGTLTHDAHIQTVEESKAQHRTPTGIERDFRDSWRYNVAAYRIDRLLDLQLVPVTVERTWNGRGAAFTWWVDEVMMDERVRIEKQLRAPDVECWNERGQALRMFDQLIQNVDRNLGNAVITRHWRLWGIDHTRAFRRSHTPTALETLRQIDRGTLDRLGALDEETLNREVGKYLSGPEVRALLARRDAIVKHYKRLGDIALVDRQDPAAGCATPPAKAP